MNSHEQMTLKLKKHCRKEGTLIIEPSNPNRKPNNLAYTPRMQSLTRVRLLFCRKKDTEFRVFVKERGGLEFETAAPDKFTQE